MLCHQLPSHQVASNRNLSVRLAHLADRTHATIHCSLSGCGLVSACGTSVWRSWYNLKRHSQKLLPMNPAQYIMARMRTCRAALDTDVIQHHETKAQLNSCFSSVGSATHRYHGDDAVGYGPGFMVVADGVSGTMKASGVLARVLVAETLAALTKLKKRARSDSKAITSEEFVACIQSATKNARKSTRRKGRLDSTITVVYFDEIARQMFVFTIGDCKCVLVRDGKVVFESDSIIYDFNVPAVVSSNHSINYVADVHVEACAYESGDVCLLFSDGVHDNLYVDQVLECVQPNGPTTTAVASTTTPPVVNAEEIAANTVKKAKATFTDSDEYIPFAVSAASFCREAVEELKMSKSVTPSDYESFSSQCAKIPACEITRPIFGREKRVRQLAFYSASNLFAFAHKKQGKRDDISVCAAVLA